MKHPVNIFFLILIFATSLSSCAQAPAHQPATLWYNTEWHYADLQVVQPPELIEPAADMVALYTRQNENGFQIRIDFLSLQSNLKSDLLVALDIQPGGSTSLPFGGQTQIQADYWIILSAQSTPTLIDSTSRLESNDLIFDRQIDTRDDRVLIDIHSREKNLSLKHARVEAYTFNPSHSGLLDQIGPTSPTWDPPAQAPVIFAFQDTLPAETPVQLLRRWNGAHSGPYGQRHGLKQLLLASTAHRVPVFLLDLKLPESLFGLNLIETFSTENSLPSFMSLQDQQLIILPEAARSPITAQHELISNREIVREFGYTDSSIVYAQLTMENLKDYKIAFASLVDSHHLSMFHHTLLIPLPATGIEPQKKAEEYVNRNGLTIDAKRALLAAATSPDPGDLLVLGGNLSQSPMADSMLAEDVFRYIANHPWIKPLNESDLIKIQHQELISFPSDCSDILCTPPRIDLTAYTSYGAPIPSGRNQNEIIKIYREALLAMPANKTGEIAWHALSILTDSTPDIDLQQIQANAFEIIGHLIQAARWENQPDDVSRCDLDIDWDGVPECILSSETFFSSYELDGARLVTTFYRQPDEVVQWIGASSQLGVGLGDPLDWKPKMGPNADPESISGSWVDSVSASRIFSVNVKPTSLYFTDTNTGLQKTFMLLPHGFSTEITTPTPFSTRVPWIITPEKRFSSAWSSTDSSLKPDVPLNYFGFPSVSISGGCSSYFDSSSDSAILFTHDEDPDMGYPSGHFLPYPMIVLNVQIDSTCQINIQGK